MSVLDAVSDRFFREVFINGIYPDASGIIFDIGALGLEYAIKVYPNASLIVALEPHPVYASRIREVIEAHQLNKITFYEMALAAKTETRQFAGLDDYGGSAFNHSGNVIEVYGISLVDLMAKTRVEAIDMLKMDIEGAEKEILTDDFPFERVKNIAFEVHATSNYLVNFLNNRGYTTEFDNSICVARRKT